MSAPDPQAVYDPPLRRTRSTGDVPRRPSSILRPDRHSDSHSDLAHQHQRHTQHPTASSSRQHAAGITLPGPTQPRLHVHSTQTTLTGAGSSSRPSPSWHPTGPPPPPPPPQPHRSWFGRTLMFFGIGRGASRERRTIVALYFTLFSGLVQIIVISVILGLSGTRLKSQTQPSLTEWVACDRPLGIWACIWVVRAILACSLTYWGFLRERKVRQRLIDGHLSSASGAATPGTAPHRTRNGPLGTPNGPGSEPSDSVARHTRDLPYARLYSRLTLLSSLLTLSWFLTAHILEYTSINTCRHSSPHVWWLTFGILCLMYLSVLEVIILSFVVFVIAPILFLFWNIILICMGRHPLQTGNMIKPEIGKLPKSLVDRIPLVIYIPPPPEGMFNDTLTMPDAAHAYPPKPPAPTVPASRKRFRFIRMLSSKKDKEKEEGSATPNDNADAARDVEKTATEPQTWEEHWERGEYPFVVLEGNRAACAICLMDFEEPKKLVGSKSTITTTAAVASTSAPKLDSSEAEGSLPGLISSGPVITVSTPSGDGDELKLADAGEGVQPLRLLECGHVFHQTCLDPWLTDVSGRCPVCQRAVILPDTKKNKRERR